jgi:hypothetical protein
VSNSFKTHGVPNLPRHAHRNGKNRHANDINDNALLLLPHEKNSSLRKLPFLAEKLILDSYSLKPSKEIIRSFLVKLEHVRGEQ